jgi:Flp pilus assembly protein TadD
MAKPATGGRSTAELREAANAKYKAGDYAGAVELYTTALDASPSNAILLTNRAAALLMLKR